MGSIAIGEIACTGAILQNTNNIIMDLFEDRGLMYGR